MKENNSYIASWIEEEKIAHIHGWDFSHIESRFEEDTDLPWDYREAILKYLKPEMKILDIDTGGGEFLLSLGHPCENMAATENFPPNIELCKNELIPKGIDFRPADGNGSLPFDNESFDMVINRHGSFNAGEIYRVLRKNGLFITQQVGADNDRELVKMLLGNAEIQFPEQYLDKAVKKFRDAGFDIIEQNEAYRSIKFFDVGALVWFARIIEWEFVGFSVEKHIENLMKMRNAIENNGSVEGKTHRFFIVAVKA